MIHLLVMLSLLSGGSTKVVENFQTECGESFYNKVPPTVLNGPQYRQICQTRNNKPYYATLYDTNNKIPVYSAYNYTGKVMCDRQSNWYIEPQLEDIKEKINMGPKGKLALNNQASNEDYKTESNILHRGHLAPVYHAASKKCSDATFTLTNAAPQYSSFNQGQWKKVEQDMASIAKERCSTANIVTGVVAGNFINTPLINNRVRVPSHFWTAYCCKNKTNILISGGVIGINSNDNLTPCQKPVKDLELELKYLYNVQSFRLFDNNCRDADYVEITNRKRPRD
ncbi:endonuclease domain-containing 1 protein-like [Misgurnus anguillicaudatus]|uniref:endonuclease domain-containing 1 protein-like n=1 Tax=Misgurnus anguillicaudatus TaxID=75329 RepID=UPI003CCF373B